MKKLLCLLLCLVLATYSYGGTIGGSPILQVGQIGKYTAIFFEPGRVVWKALGNGISVSGSYEFATVTGVKAGAYVLTAQLYNNNGICIDSADLLISVYPILSVADIIGKSDLRPNETYIFEAADKKGTKYIWSFPSEYFDIISGASTGTVKVKTKEKLGTDYIKAEISYPDLGFLTAILKFTVSYPTEMVSRTDFICTNDTISYQILNATNQDPITWTPINNLVLVSGQGTPKATFKGVNNGYAKVKAEIKYQNKTILLENSKTWVGAPQISLQGMTDEASLSSSYIDIGNRIQFSALTTLSIDGKGITSSNSDFEWQNNTGESIFTIGNGRITNPIDNGKGSIGQIATFGFQAGAYKSLMFKIRAKNKCGWSDWKYITWRGTIISGGFRSAMVELDNQPELKSVKIYNLSGILVYSNDNINSHFDIKSTILTDGIYIIEESDGRNKISKKFILKR